jgi:hypothetical protein
VACAALLYAQSPPAKFTYERPFTATASGPQRLPVDPALLLGSNPFRVVQRGETVFADGGLSDLRVFDAAGTPVPYLLVHAPRPEPKWTAGTILPVAQTKKTSGFEVDFGSAQAIDMIRVEGIPAPFLKRLSVEGSGDRARWTSLAPEATLFDLPDERLRQLAVGFTPGDYRYVRVTFDDTNTARVPPPRRVGARLAARTPIPPPATLDLPFDRQASEPGRSRYRVRLPAARLPLVALVLEVDGGHVLRAATVTESRFSGAEAAPVELGRAMLSRVVRNGVQASDLTVSIAPPIETELQLLIENGSNPPLEVEAIRGTVAQLPWIYLEAPAGELIARYGDRTLQAPSYDLEAVRPSIDITRVPDAKWAAPRALVTTETAASEADAQTPAAGAAIDAGGFEYVREIVDRSPGLSALPLDAAALAQSRGPGGRFADVRILDEQNRQIPYLLERRDEPLQIDVKWAPAETKLAELTRGPGRQLSVYRVTLPYANLPPATLVLETSARVFLRNVQLGIERPADRRKRDPWFEQLASATWRHADQERPARPLTLRLEQPAQPDLLLVVDEGDNALLPIASAKLLLPSYRLRFYHPPGGALRLAYGRDDLQSPRYDLALLAQQVMGAPARDVAAAAGAAASPAAGGDPRLISPLTFWILLGAAVLVLVGIIVRLIRQS